MNEYLTGCIVKEEYELSIGHENPIPVEDDKVDVCDSETSPDSYPYHPSVRLLRTETTRYPILQRLQPYWEYDRVRETETGSSSPEPHATRNAWELQDEAPKNRFRCEIEYASVLSRAENDCHDVCAYG